MVIKMDKSYDFLQFTLGLRADLNAYRLLDEALFSIAEIITFNRAYLKAYKSLC